MLRTDPPGRTSSLRWRILRIRLRRRATPSWGLPSGEVFRFRGGASLKIDEFPEVAAISNRLWAISSRSSSARAVASASPRARCRARLETPK